jgi:hypothetical protein
LLPFQTNAEDLFQYFGKFFYEIREGAKLFQIEGGKSPAGCEVVENLLTVQKEKPGRNDKCPCGSGKKYKKCHGNVVSY